MGQISRTNRAARFIKEFGRDLTRKWPVGKVYVLKRAYLAAGELTEGVRTYLELEHPDGLTFTVVCDDYVWFDPEHDYDLADMVERLSGQVTGDIEARLKKADLP